VGGFLLLIGTYLHPMGADPNDPTAAFTEYAADSLWVVSHLTQLAGVMMIVVALVVLSEIMAGGPARPWAVLGSAGAVASLAAAAALQAVDGVALKHMVDRWATADASDRLMIFHAAVGVRQIEVGLASVMSLLFGATFIVYGIAVLAHRDFSKWLAWLAMVGGGGALVSGTVTAYTGFSSLAMNISMSATVTLLVWLVAVALRLLRGQVREPR
jgi:hypothetical protein